MKSHRSLVGRIMDFAVSGYVYFVALTLVIFMVGTLVTSVFGVVLDLIDIFTSSTGFAPNPDRAALEVELLHTIAFTIVLVKAYKILMAFAETRFINIKFLVEISIIGPTIELVFNASKYDFMVNLLFAGFALGNLLIYLFFYKTLKQASVDNLKENGH